MRDCSIKVRFLNNYFVTLMGFYLAIVQEIKQLLFLHRPHFGMVYASLSFKQLYYFLCSY